MKYEDCKKCPKYLCKDYNGNDRIWLFSLGKIVVLPACSSPVTLKEFRVYVEDNSRKSRYNPYKNFETLEKCINCINKKFKKELDFENMIQLTKIRQELKMLNDFAIRRRIELIKSQEYNLQREDSIIIKELVDIIGALAEDIDHLNYKCEVR